MALLTPPLGWAPRQGTSQSSGAGTGTYSKPAPRSYRAHLVSEWIPSLYGATDMLDRGAKVADIGCGHGASTLIMAEAFPNSSFSGFDYHVPSIHRARQAAREAGVSDRVVFEAAAAKEYSGHDYDLVCAFDCLHDMGDPVGACAHVRDTLAPGGAWMIVEPYAHDRVEQNLTPVEARLREVLVQGGFRRVRRAAETPFNVILEARL